MDSGLFAVTNGALRAEMHLDVLTNNLANANTTGFKEAEITFDSFMTTPGTEQFPLAGDTFMGLRGPGDVPFPFHNPATNAYSVTYPRADGTHTNMEQGPVSQTGNTLDVAIDGEGFFVVQTPHGVRYTRDGAFAINERGMLVSKEGHPIMGTGGSTLTIGSENVQISEDGTISGPAGPLGRLLRVGLPVDALEMTGGNLYRAPAGQETPLEGTRGGFLQGFLEKSNTNTVRGMAQIIQVNRAFEVYMQMIKAMDGIDGQAIQVGRLT